MMNRQNILKLAQGLIVSYIVSGVFLLLTAFALWKWNLSEMMVNGAMLLTYIISTAVGGFYIGKKLKEKKFLWGMLLGVFYVFFLLAASALVNGPEGLLNMKALTIAFICVLSGMLGGMVA